MAKWFDFAWLKQWWPEVTRRMPHVGMPKRLKLWRYGSSSVRATTKSEARASLKRILGIHRKGRLPANAYVTPIRPAGLAPAGQAPLRSLAGQRRSLWRSSKRPSKSTS